MSMRRRPQLDPLRLGAFCRDVAWIWFIIEVGISTAQLKVVS